MAGLNTTGLPRTSDYVLGRGKVYAAPLSSGVPGAFRDLGNATEFGITVESETLEHASSREGLKTIDKEVVISQKVSVSLTLDELNFENLALFLSGSAVSNTAIANSTVGQSVGTFSSNTEVVGRWIDLYGGTLDAPSERVYGMVVAGTQTGSSIDGLTEGEDYELDLEMGRIFFYATGTPAPTAPTLVGTSNNRIHVILTSSADGAVDEVRALTQTNVSVALKFIAENPADNDAKTEYVFHSVSLKAEGDLPLIGDEYATMQLSGVAEANAIGGGASSPTLTIRANAA